MEKIFGIDIGGTNVKIGVVETNGTLLDKVKYPTKEVAEDGRFVENFIEILKKHFEIHPDISRVGIGVPGTISKDRRMTLELSNIPSLNYTPFIERLEEAFPKKHFALENDANAAALGEFCFSLNENIADSFLFITLGTGVGGAAIIDKEIFTGANGNGMEVGHMISSSGKVVEAHAGKKGIVAAAHKYLKKEDKKSFLDQYDGEFTAKEVVKGAKKGDAICLKVFRKVGKKVGECIVSSLRVLDLNTIYIGGGVSDTFPFIQESMHSKINDYLSEYYTKNLTIEVATLENEAGIVGAASLCLKMK